MTKQRGYSLSGASRELEMLLSPLVLQRATTGVTVRPTRELLFLEELSDLPIVVLERDGDRQAVSPTSLSEEPVIWTVSSNIFRRAELLIEDLPGDISIDTLLGAGGSHFLPLPDEPVLCNFGFSSVLRKLPLRGRVVSSVAVDLDHRRVDCKWTQGQMSEFWQSLLPDDRETLFWYRQIGSRGSLRLRRSALDGQMPTANVWIARHRETFTGASDLSGVVTEAGHYITADSEIGVAVIQILDKASGMDPIEAGIVRGVIDNVLAMRLSGRIDQVLDDHDRISEQLFNMMIQDLRTTEIATIVDVYRQDRCQSCLRELMAVSSIRIFNPYAWVRKASTETDSYE